jgi:hypothetical protein
VPAGSNCLKRQLLVRSFLSMKQAAGRVSVRRRTHRPEVVTKLHKEISAGLADPTMRARIAQLGGVVMPLSPADFSDLLRPKADAQTSVAQRDTVAKSND